MVAWTREEDDDDGDGKDEEMSQTDQTNTLISVELVSVEETRLCVMLITWLHRHHPMIAVAHCG